MAKICLEDRGNGSIRIKVDGTGEELINLFSNAFLKEGYLRAAAAKGLADCIMFKYMVGDDEKPSKEKEALEMIHTIIADVFDKDMKHGCMDVYLDALVRIEIIVRDVSKDEETN